MVNVFSKNLKDALHRYPFILDFFESYGIPLERDLTVEDAINSIPDERLEEIGITRDALKEQLLSFIGDMESLLEEERVESITIIGGKDKSGNREDIRITVRTGEIISIVGPTGSGKSRLLADIDWMAQGDTPTGRVILVNGREPKKEWRFSVENKLVAQLSQNMNFVIDLTVAEFLNIHAESRLVENPEEKVREILERANELAGERFYPDTPVTSLSGGQSRALMIADTAILSKSPIVLIDEIENAGIDRKQAIELLIEKDKIVFMATHDPILALMADRRFVIENGGIRKVIETSDNEKRVLEELRKLDMKLLEMRNRLRRGERIEGFLSDA